MTLPIALTMLISVIGAFGSGCDCSGGKRDWVVGEDSISGKLSATDASACCALCVEEEACVAWTFASGLQGNSTCWLKDNVRGEHAEEGRISGGCTPPSPSRSSVSVTLGDRVVATTDPRFLSFTLDWWDGDQGAAPEGWGPSANVLEIDLESARLRALTSALGPAFLRIGGSLDNDVGYAFPGSGVEYNSSSCPAKLCLNTTRWDQLNAFVEATHSQLVFGLSYPGKDTGVWNSTQALALFDYSQAKGYNRTTSLYGFELGEELTGFKVNTSEFDQYTRSYGSARTLLDSVFGPKPSAARPQLMGPCPGMSWPQLADWFPAFLAATAPKGALDVAVYHSYNQYDPPTELYCNRTVPAGGERVGSGDTGWQAVLMAEYAEKENVPVWLGEGGPHNGGGHGPDANTFVASFTYLDTLGTLAEVGNAVFARQTLVGGNYELLRCTSAQLFPGETCDFEPRPDYWVALLWNRLMGSRTLAPLLVPASNGADDVRVYQHCTAGTNNGSLTLSFSNKAPTTTYNITFVYGGAPLGPRLEYRLSSANHTDPFASRDLLLNGSPLSTGPPPAVVPQIHPVWAPAPPKGQPVVLEVPPATLGFVVFPDAKFPACSRSQQR